MIRLAVILIILTSAPLAAQEFTTVILVRHAEKDMTASTNDPDLSEEGKLRQRSLMHSLREMNIDAIFSTPYKRTMQTVELLADSTGIQIGEYNPFDEEQIHSILHENEGGTILFSGHSNTVPAMLNMLTQSSAYKPFPESAYDDLFIVVLYGTEARVHHLQYYPPD